MDLIFPSLAMAMRVLYSLFAGSLIVMALVASPSSAKLSIPLSDDYARAGLVNSTSHVIANEPRTLEVNGKIYPLNDGPVFRNGTLYAQQIMKQFEVIRSMANPKVVDIKKRVREIILSSKGDTRVTVESYHKVYAALEKANVIVQPKSIDNSDASFGAMRLGIKGYNLKLVRDSEYSKYIDHLSDAQVADVCGWHSKSQKTQISGARKDHRIFVSDFSKHREYTDEAAQHQKYVPSVIGFFCYNTDKRQLLPFAITILDTKLTYTTQDTPEEWQLAKMALDAADANFQQMRHFVEVHMMSIPVQVEMMRSMATNHPIYALLDYHFFTNFALEHLARTALFAAKSDYDQTMAFGASGSLRYIYQDFDKVSFQDDFPTDIEARGLRYLPIHRYAKYGKKYYKAVKEFVTSYVHAYYPTDAEVRNDSELQLWAKRASQIKKIHGFPTEFRSRSDLIKLVTHLVFLNSVKHHFMNGAVTWHGSTAPYSTGAIWNKPLPTKKGVKVNPLDYAIPLEKVPELVSVNANFLRPVPRKYTALESYNAAPFTNEPKLTKPIAEFHNTMEALEKTIVEAESKEELPNDLMKPSLMPHFPFI